jgi:hypothetical protein
MATSPSPARVPADDNRMVGDASDDRNRTFSADSADHRGWCTMARRRPFGPVKES